MMSPDSRPGDGTHGYAYTSPANYAREQRRREPLHVQREGMMLRARPERFARPSALVNPRADHPSVSVERHHAYNAHEEVSQSFLKLFDGHAHEPPVVSGTVATGQEHPVFRFAPSSQLRVPIS
ncbi:hypothetical protein K466DRAFT_272373 [Polyporus arcularius HHB13444]|uniref:Uncharacterized protein n=1 Tax=Polyporus arcularius HHB13444 TaxID=1314778 RepID=A0A5C3P3E9_9APHY|nr:hypothetical protein K466DRAFT_272373 [Polyporus arcularius HHB13444]